MTIIYNSANIDNLVLSRRLLNEIFLGLMVSWYGKFLTCCMVRNQKKVFLFLRMICFVVLRPKLSFVKTPLLFALNVLSCLPA